MRNYRYNYGVSGRRGDQSSGGDDCLCTDQPVSLAMSYVKNQKFGKVYDAKEALDRGTLFPELYMPFSGGVGR